jgi:hypothetical protein
LGDQVIRVLALILLMLALLVTPAWAINQSVVPNPGGSGNITVVETSQFVTCTASCNVQPLSPHPGYQLCVQSANNVAAVITLKALGGSASYQNTARTAYGTPGTGTLASLGSTGDQICVVGFQDGVGTMHYNVWSNTNTWNIN